MGDSTTVTEELLPDRLPDVVTEDGPSGSSGEPADHEDADHPSSGELDAADFEPEPNAEAEAGEDDGHKPGDDKPPRQSKNAWQKSVDRLTRQRAELERTLAEERGRRLALEELIAKGISPKAAAEQLDAQEAESNRPEEPQPEDFDSIEDYAKAYSKWEREAEAATAPKPSAPAREEQWAPSQESLEVRQQSFEAAKARFEDVEDRLDAVAPALSLPMLKAIEFDEDGASIMAALADHPDELKRIASLTSEAQVSKALQRFAGRVLVDEPSASTPAKPDLADNTDDDTPRINRQPPAVRVSRAQPIGTVLNGGRVSGSVDLDSLNQAEYEEEMNRREARRRR